MAIPTDHSPLAVDGVVYDLTHLAAFWTAIPGKGIDVGTDLGVLVVFSNHVYTERAKHGEPSHAFDHHGTRRVFDRRRYDMSRSLAGVLADVIIANGLTHVSKSYGGIDNLIVVETKDRETWVIVYCFHPLEDGRSVRMEVLSCHRKVIDQGAIRRRNLSYFARLCLYHGARVPKA